MPAPIAIGAMRANDAKNRGSTMGHAGARAAGEIVERNQDGVILQTVHKAGGIGDSLFMADFMMPMAAGILGGTVGKLPWVGPRIKLMTDGLLKAPLAAAKATTMGDIAHLPAAYFSNMASSTSLSGVSGAFTDISSKLGGVKEISATHLAATSGAFGTTGLQAFAAKRATAGLKSIQEEATAATTALTAEQQGIVDRTMSAIGLGKKTTEVPKAANSNFAEIEKSMQLFGEEIGREAHSVDMKAASEHLSSAKEALGRVAADPKIDKKVADMGTAINGFEQRMSQVSNHMNTARGSQTVAEAAKTGFKNMSVYDVGFKGGMAAGSLYYTARTVKNFRQAINGLRELNEDLTGQKTSFLGMVTGGGLSPLIAEARSNMMQRFLPEALSATASAGLNLLWMKRHMGMREHVVMGAAMMTQMGVSELMPKENFLDSYLGMKDMQAAGHAVPVEAYAALISGASADAREAGGVESRLIKALATDYAKDNKTALEVLKEIQDKKPYMERAQRVALEVKDADEAHKAQKAVSAAVPAMAVATAKPAPTLQATPGAQLVAAKHDGMVKQTMQQELGA